jgi:hypothetical protein
MRVRSGKRLRWLLLIAAYAIFGPLTVGAEMADLQFRFPNIARQEYRANLGFSVFLGLMPPGWVVVFLHTGFYEHGFRFTRPEGSKT